MTSPISPISAPFVSPVSPTSGQTPSAGSVGATKAPSVGSSPSTADGAEDFAGAIGSAVAEGLNAVGRLEGTVTEASKQAAVGNLDSISDFMIATAEAQLATEITVAVRDRAVTAFNDIMRMQI